MMLLAKFFTSRSVLQFFISSAALLLVGCGYQFQGGGSILPPDIKTVGIAVTENNTTESNLGLRFTEALRDRFERYGVVKVLDDTESADAILTSQIVGVNTGVRDVTGDTDIALQMDLSLVVSAELRRRNGQLLWKNSNIVVSQSFAGVGGVVVTSSAAFSQGGIGASTLQGLGASEVSRGQKEQALEDLVDESSRKIYLEAVAADF